MSDQDFANAREQIQRSKLNRKVCYFAIFTIFIEILIKKKLANERD